MKKHKKVKPLKPVKAQKIHDMLMASGDVRLIRKYKETLMSDISAQDKNWRGTELPENLAWQLRNEFGFSKYGINKLAKTNVVSAGGAFIELSVLARALPEDFVARHFKAAAHTPSPKPLMRVASAPSRGINL